MTPVVEAKPDRQTLLDRPVPGASEIREILFPSDLTPASDRAFEHAALIAERLGARVTLYHVVRSHVATDPGLATHPRQEAVRRKERDAHDQLERRAAGLTSEAAVLVEHDESIHRALLRTLKACNPDLTVMSTHARGPLAQLFVGSVAETALNAARAPLLLVRETDHGVALPYRRILVPTDMSLTSGRAFAMAALIARAFGAEVIALHVAAPLLGDPTFGTSGVTYEVEARVPSEAALCQFLGSEFAGVKVLPRVLIGSAWDCIIETAALEHADLIVMSTHGRDSLADRVIGSHTERVIRHASCPVLVV